MVDKQYLLTSAQMAGFAAAGLLRVDELIPEAINREAMRELEEKLVNFGYEPQGQPLSNLWRESKGFGAMIRLLPVQGIIQSLVGPHPLYDHHCPHRVAPGYLEG